MNHDRAQSTILVVDDTPATLQLLSRALTRFGFKVATATDGESAIAAARLYSPDLILLDVRMPEIDGFAACRRLKADPQLQEIPVIFMTAAADDINTITGFTLGGVDYIVQPCQVEEIIARIQVHLRLQQLTRTLEAQNQQLQQEIQTRQQTEMALRESEQRYATLTQLVPVGLFRYNIAGQLVYVNDRWCEMADMTAAEAMGEGWVQALHPSDRDQIMREWFQAILQQVPYEGEGRFLRRDGMIRWLYCQAAPEYDPNHQLIGYVGSITDITDRKQTEAALRHSESRLAIAQRIAHIGSWEFDLLTQEITWSEELFHIYGLDSTQPEPTYAESAQKVVPEDWQQLKRAIEQASIDGSPYQVEHRIVRPDGTIRCLLVRGEAMTNEQGQVIKLCGTGQDITETRQTELALRESERQLSLALTAAKAGTWQWNMLTNETVWSDENFRLMGYEPETCEATYENWFNAVHPEDQAMANDHVTRSLVENSDLYLEYRIVLPGSSIRWLADIGQITYDGQGNQTGMIGIQLDITDRKQAELELQRLNEELELRIQQRTEELQHQTQLLQTILNSMGDGVLVADTTGAIILHNPAAEEIIGERIADAHARIGQQLWSICLPDGDVVCPIEELPFLRTMQGEALDQVAVILQSPFHPDGIHVEATIRPLVDESGTLTGSVAVFRDVSDRKRAETQLREQEEFLRTIYEGVSHPIFVADVSPDGSIRRAGCNAAAEQLAGLKNAEVIGKPIAEDVGPVPGSVILERCLRCVATETPLTVEDHLSWNGQALWTISTYHPLKNRDGQVYRIVGTITDITDRKQVEARLWETQQFLTSILSSLPTAVVAKEAQSLRFVLLNPAAAEVLDMHPTTCIGKTDYDLFPPDQADFFTAIDRQVLASGQTIEIAEELARIRGEDRILRTKKTAILDESGQPQYLLAITEDITDAKRAEIALRESQQFAQSIADNTPAILYIYDLVNQCNLYTNQSITTLLGYPIEALQVMGSNLLANLIHPEDLERLLSQQAALAVADDGQIHELEYRICHADGSWRWLYDRATVFKRDAAGNVTQIIGSAQDISDRKYLEQEQAKLTAILEASSDFIGVANSQGQVLWINHQMKQLLGDVPAASATALHIANFHPQWAVELILHQGLAVAAQAGQWLGEAAVQTAAGEEIPVSQLIMSHRSSTGEVAYYSTIMRDIREQQAALRERKQAEADLRRANTELEFRVEERTAELRQAKEAAEAANHAKSAFLANMSHELRTPLNAILGFGQLMVRDASLPDKPRENLAIINRSGEHLLQLINNILEMSKIEAGQVPLNPTNFNLYALLDNLTEMFRLRSETKGLQLSLDRSTNVPQYIQSDENKLRQILINLLGNAVKFTTQGSVLLRVRIEPECDRLLAIAPDQSTDSSSNLLPAYLLRFEVEDTGPGISSAALKTLFNPFVQAELGQKSQEGTGLGLAICRQYVRLLGGEITLDSTVGQGTIARFTAQVHLAQAPEEQKLPIYRQVIGLAPGQPTYRILVAEDNLVNCKLLTDLLLPLGFEVREASNGQAAIELWASWQPDLIWMDMRMPEIDGYEATQQIRAKEQEYQNAGVIKSATKIIALTASAFEEQRTKILAIGCDGLVRKPFKVETLLETIGEYLGVRYLYAEPDHLGAIEGQRAENSVSEPPKLYSLQPASLQVMPRAWISAFQQATLLLDEKPLLQLIAQIPAANADLAQALRAKIKEFEFEALLNLAEQALSIDA